MSDAMSDADYELTQECLVMAANVIAALDLNAFLSRISKAKALGPIVDPTLYKTAGERLDDVRRLAGAALELYGEVHRQREKYMKKEPAS